MRCFTFAAMPRSMAHGVHEALITIAGNEGGKTREDAEAWVKQLKADKQYLRDVY